MPFNSVKNIVIEQLTSTLIINTRVDLSFEDSMRPNFNISLVHSDAYLS